MKKVMVGLSGGVDSAVSAHLLIKEGYEVVGAFMRNWDSTLNNDFIGNTTINDPICPQETDYNDAKAVAKALNIPLLRIDFIKEYWDNVFTYFLEEYKQGRTPNPDILCNKYIKFDYFLKFALDNGADYMATGHYAAIRRKEGRIELLRGLDNNKDQSYFLSQLSKEQLAKSIFPLGNLHKKDVRKIAQDLNLPIATKKDSTGICFIGERNFRQFLSNYLPAQKGKIVDINSDTVVGEHDGVMYYTIGQRKGMNIGGIKGYATDSWFVVAKNIETKTLYVAQGDNNKWLLKNYIIVNNINLINKLPRNNWIACSAKFRYRQKDCSVKIRHLNDDLLEVKCDEAVLAVTEGQAAVFYQDEVCLGGGTIVSSELVN